MANYRQLKSGEIVPDYGQPASVGKKRVDVPDAFHADQIRGHETGNPGLKAASEWLGSTGQTLKDLNALRMLPNPMLTPAANDLEIQQEVDRLREKHGRDYDRLKATYYAEVDRVRKEIDKATKLNEPSKYELLIVDAFLKAKPNERQSMLAKALEAGDASILGPILNAPLMLTGLTAEQVSSHRDAFEKRVAPELASARDQLRAGETAIQNGFVAFYATFDKMKAGTNAEGEALQKLETIKSKLRNEAKPKADVELTPGKFPPGIDPNDNDPYGLAAV